MRDTYALHRGVPSNLQDRNKHLASHKHHHSDMGTGKQLDRAKKSSLGNYKTKIIHQKNKH